MAWYKLINDPLFVALKEKVMKYLREVSWRQTLLSALEHCGFDSVESVQSSARTFKQSDADDFECAVRDLLIALLLSKPRSVKMGHSCFEGVTEQ